MAAAAPDQLRRCRIRDRSDHHAGHRRQVLPRQRDRYLREQAGQGHRLDRHRSQLLHDQGLRDHQRPGLYGAGSAGRDAGAGSGQRTGKQAVRGPGPGGQGSAGRRAALPGDRGGGGAGQPLRLFARQVRPDAVLRAGTPADLSHQHPRRAGGEGRQHHRPPGRDERGRGRHAGAAGAASRGRRTTSRWRPPRGCSISGARSPGCCSWRCRAWSPSRWWSEAS